MAKIIREKPYLYCNGAILGIGDDAFIHAKNDGDGCEYVFHATMTDIDSRNRITFTLRESDSVLTFRPASVLEIRDRLRDLDCAGSLTID